MGSLGGLDRRALAVVALALLLLVPAVPALAPTVDGAPWLAWRVETVDFSGVGTSFATSLGMSDSGDVHISFQRGGARYATSHDSGWAFERIDKDGSATDLALDSDSTPHVSYRKKTTRNEVWYAVREDEGWATHQIDPLGIADPQIAVDPDDGVHVLYEKSDGPDDEIRYATQDSNGGWSIETIHHSSMFTSDLAIDSGSTPHAVYSLDTDPEDTIRYATKDDQGQWVTASLPDCRFGVGIDVDALDRPHIACWGIDGLQYHTYDGQHWVQETVSDGSNLVPPRAPINTGLEPSIAVDSQLNPHISFRTRTSSGFDWQITRPAQLHYATKVDGEWSLETVDRDGSFTGAASSVALDSLDRPHIAYLHIWRRSGGFPDALDALEADWDLRYATPLLGSVAGAVGR